MCVTLQPNWATASTRTFVQMPECRTVRYRNKGTPVRCWNATVPDRDAGCRYTDASGIGLDADAQPMPWIWDWLQTTYTVHWIALSASQRILGPLPDGNYVRSWSHFRKSVCYQVQACGHRFSLEFSRLSRLISAISSCLMETAVTHPGYSVHHNRLSTNQIVIS